MRVTCSGGWKTALILTVFIASQGVHAAPYDGEAFTYRQPDGEAFQVRLYGDEFFAYQQTDDGHLVIRDPESGFFCYAEVTPDGTRLVSTGVRVGANKPPGLQPGQRLAAGKAMSLSLENRNLLRVDAKGRPNPGKKLIEKADGKILSVAAEGGDPAPAPGGGEPPVAPAPPSSPTIDQRVGLVLLASFPDRPGDVTKTVAEIDDYCNAETYTVNGNATSIYGYFKIQSNGKLLYKNTVTAWFTAANNRDYYTDNTQSYGSRARDLIREGLAVLKAQGFDFTQCDGNGDGRLDGVNIFYAGSRVNAWSEGLWPHQSSSSWTGLSGTGLSSTSYDYQITDMPASLTIGTFCHENGHMICDFPDLYAYDNNAANMGSFTLMASSGSTHPRHVDPYLKIHAGWADVVDLNSSSHLQGAVQQDRNFFYRYRNPARSQEYFLFEVRGNDGYEGPWGGAGSTNPADGLVIYHALETGSNTYSSINTGDSPLDYSTPFELLVVEATPKADIPWYSNPTPGSDDAFKSSGVNSISDGTTPGLRFWASDGRTVASGADIHSISGPGPTMTFVAGSGGLPTTPVTGVTIAQLNPRVDFGGNAASGSFAVFNKAGGTLSYSVSDNAGWLSCSPAGGTATTEADVIAVTYSTSGLAAGTHNASITVDGGSAGSAIIPVTLTVDSQAALAASPGSFSLAGISGATGPTDRFNLSNTGGGTAAYTLSKTQSWLALDRTSGTVATEQDLVTISLDATGLAPGTYNDTITITSASASNSPLSIPVSFTVDDVDMVLTAPNGGETWFVDGTHEITWASTLGGNVRIELLKGGSLDSTIAVSTVNDGSHTWMVPGAQALGSDYRIRVTSVESPTKSDESFGDFTIAQDLIALAVDTTGLTWSSGGDAPWFRQTTTTQDGVDAAQSGLITHSQTSSMETTLSQEGTLSFWWKVSSESSYDYLRFYLNDVEQGGSLARISGNVDWVQKTVTIPAGINTVKWAYTKDGSVDRNSDAGWVDQVVFTPAVATYTVSYDGNGNTGGGVPSDQTKTAGIDLTLATNVGNLVKTGFAFEGWNTNAAGTGTDYAAGGTYATDADVTLYAKWTAVPTYTVTFDGNGNTGGSVPSSQVKTQGVPLTLSGNTGNLTRTGFGFSGWNTQSDGNGTGYAAGGSFNIDANTTLYAAWNASPAVHAGADRVVYLSEDLPWTPEETTTALWLDASDTTKITLNGSTVSEWRDKSGNSRHASQATASSQPAFTAGGLNSMSVLTFDGATDFLNVDLDFLAGTSHSTFIVTKATNYTDIYGAANASQGANSLHVGFRSNTSYRMNYWSNDWYGAISPEFVHNEANLLNYVWLPSTRKEIFANATSQGSSTNAGNIGTMSGGGRIGQVVNHGYYGGDIAEVIMCTGTVGTEDKQRFEGYLAHKWGLTGKLPAAHPYKSAVPGGSGMSAVADLSDATVADPEGDGFTTTWSLVSGPAGVTFADPGALHTTATFTAAGTYILRLTVDDGNGPAFDEVTIVVNPPTAFMGWAAAYGVTADQQGNTDGDTLTELLEFAFGTDPTLSDAGPVGWGGGASDAVPGTPRVVTPTFSSGGGVNFTARFMRRKDRDTSGSVHYAWRFSSNLTDWESSDDSPPWLTPPQVLAEDPSGDYQLVEIVYPFWLSTYRKARFFQVEVTPVP
ncbi:M6 family metalloprotease domain-containing protein [Haloferula sp. A504]|uniref:M6 family metalloprotease domain-containing protein n=1 Tax=Haloferula sp. A504 TaxID=3373601 RepID=UPI0031C40B06|nr:M6 family metalloprotease domain-containing protein [Verrucomicrobiaceae bacterium E54]